MRDYDVPPRAVAEWTGDGADMQSELIVLWAEDVSHARRDLIGQAVRDAVGERRLVFVDQLDQIREAGEARVIVVLNDPVLSLAGRLDAGQKAEAALADWQAWVRALLAGLRRHRRWMTLVDDETFFDAASPHETTIAERCGLIGVTGLERPQPDTQPDRLARLAAYGLLSLDPSTQALVAELRALTLTPERPAVNVAAIGAVLAEASELRASTASAVARAEDLDRQFQKVSAETEANQSALRQEIERLERLAQAGETTIAAERELAEATARVGLKSAEEFDRRLAELSKNAEERSAENGLLREALSLSTRLLDEFKIAFDGLRDKNGALLERQTDQVLLLAQSEGLERRLTQSEDRGRRRDAVLGATILLDGRRIEDLQARVVALTEAARQSETSLAERQRQIEALEAELNRVYGSKSWKLTGPARAVASKLPSK